MLIARPARLSDDKDLFELARLAGPGFTSLAVGKEALFERLEKSVKTFKQSGPPTPDSVYLLMLENQITGEILGMSAVKAQIGIADPFFNFRVMKMAQQSAVTKKRFDMEVLMLVNEYAGASEVSSLFVKKSARGTGAGRLISQARYMLIATDPARFGDKIISELRGHVDDNGYSPFWEAIGRKFFQMDFNEADQVSASLNNQFILDLMPKHPIYAALLPKEAQDVMGQTHPLGVGARRFLEKEGFRYDGIIDIFDGGPSVTAPSQDIRTIRESRRITAVSGAGEFPLNALVCNDDIHNFRSIFTSVRIDSGEAVLPVNAMTALNLKSGDAIRIWIKR